MPDDELLTIGRFARLCRLSIKQLRHYDRIGLLRPAHTDPASGYRYYVSEQAGDALTIAMLRDLEVPLPVIGEVLAAGGERRAGILAGQRERLAGRIARDRDRLAVLDRLADGRRPGHRVSVVEEEARRLCVVRATVGDAVGIGAAMGECVGRLLAVAAWPPPVYGLFPLDLADGMRIAAGVRMPESGLVPAGAEAERLPAGSVATTEHAGPYAQLPLAYHALLTWIGGRGLRPHGPAYETYLVGPDEADDPEDLVTRVSIPVSR